MKHDHNWTEGNDELGSTVEHRPVGKLVQQSLGETVQFGSSKPTQSPKPIEDRSGKPVAQKIVSVLQEELSSSDRPGKPATEEEQHVRNHDKSGKLDGEEKQHIVQEDCHLKSRDKVDKFDLATDDANIDFNVSGIPEEAVKRSENFNILQLIRRTHVTHSKKPFRTTLINNNHSMHLATSRRVLSWMQETLRFPRSSDQICIGRG